MASKAAPKEKALKGDEADELVLQYLKSTNRPYASTDVSANLKGKVPKPAAQKILQALADKGLLTMKTYGKQTIFVYNQSQLSALSKEEMSDLDGEAKTVNAELEVKRKELKSGQSDLAKLDSLPKTSEIGTEIDQVASENAVNIKTLLPLRGDGSGPKVEPLSSEEIKKIDVSFANWRKVWVARRKVYSELLGFLQDCEQVQDKVVFEDEQGISPDDDDAKEVETSDFCRPQAITRPPRANFNGAAKKIKPHPITTAINDVKRSSTTPDASQEQPPAKKKKTVKKVQE